MNDEKVVESDETLVTYYIHDDNLKFRGEVAMGNILFIRMPK